MYTEKQLMFKWKTNAGSLREWGEPAQIQKGKLEKKPSQTGRVANTRFP